MASLSKTTTLKSKIDYIKEFIKCKDDYRYFIKEYIEIELPGGNIKLKLYNRQDDFLRSIMEDHHVIALKSRQTGISTVTQAFISYVCTFFDNVVIGVVSKDSSESTDFCRKIMSMIDNLPDWLRPKYVKQTEQSFILKNGCKFYAQAIDPKNPQKLFRGKSITIAVMDEAAHTQYIEKAWIGFGPALIKNQSVAEANKVPYATIVISTPNKCTGIGRWFFESWRDAHTLDSIYKPHQIYWRDIPEFANDVNWYKNQCRILRNDQNVIDQEMELRFISTEGALFSPQTIEKLNTVFKKPIKQLKLKDNYTLDIWEDYDPDKFYLVGADTASSHGGDKSTIEITEFETMNQVAEFQGKLRIDDFNKVIEKVLSVYPNSLLIPEQNSYGEAVVEYFTSHEREIKRNLYYDSKKFKYGCQKIVYGLPTTGKSRPLMIESLFSSITDCPEIVRSQKLSLELISLEENTRGKIEASKDAHDDLVMAKALNLYVRNYDPTVKSKYSSRNENIYTHISSIVEENNIDMLLEPSSLDIEMQNIESDLRKEDDKDSLDKRNLALRKFVRNKIDSEIDPNKLKEIFFLGKPLNLDDGDFTDIFG